MTQEELAERAALTARAIRDLERGAIRRPRRTTVQQLIAAFGLCGDEASLFVAVARGHAGTPGEEPRPASLRVVAPGPDAPDPLWEPTARLLAAGALAAELALLLEGLTAVDPALLETLTTRGVVAWTADEIGPALWRLRTSIARIVNAAPHLVEVADERTGRFA